jgi:hypothetical protein
MMLFESQEPARNVPAGPPRPGARAPIWLSNAAIFALTAASTAALLLCPCDRPGGSRSAVILVALSSLFGLAAAALIYRRLQTMSGITEFLKAVIALAIAGGGVYAEFILSSDVVAWLAQRGIQR